MLLLCAAAPVPQDPIAFHEVSVWDRISLAEIGGPGEVTHAFVAELTADGILDVVFLHDGELAVLVNPGHSKQLVEPAPGRTFVDVAPFGRGSGASDALFTFGSSGLSAWRLGEAGFEEEVLLAADGTEPWEPSTLMATQSLPTGFAVVALVDPTASRLFSFVVEERRGPGEATSVKGLTSVCLPSGITRIALFDAQVSQPPALAVARATGLTVESLTGMTLFSLAAGSEPVETVGLCPFGFTSSARDHVAWIHRSGGGTSSTVVVLDGVGAEPPQVLPGRSVLGAAVDTDSLGLPRLALSLTTPGILLLSCDSEGPCFEAEEAFLVGNLFASGPPVLADFHVDEPGGLPDLLLFEPSTDQAVIQRSHCREMETETVIGSMALRHFFEHTRREALGNPRPPTRPILEFSLEAPPSLAQATEIALVVSGWHDHEVLELGNPLAAPLVLPFEPFLEGSLSLQLGHGPWPELIAGELRFTRDVNGQREALAVIDFGMPRPMSAAEQDVVDLVPAWCTGGATGGMLRGIVRLPGLPQRAGPYPP